MQTTAGGNQQETCTSNPYGDGLSCTGGADATEQHFTGKDHDAESNLDYFGARYYSETLGRFMTPDWAAAPAAVPYAAYGDPQSLNLYAYVQNNPLTGIDVDGHTQPGPQCPGCSWQDEWANNSGWEQEEAYDSMEPHPSDDAEAGDSSTPPTPPGDHKKGPGFWSRLGHGFSNLLHGHAWGYLAATVTYRETDTLNGRVVGGYNPIVTAVTDAASLAAGASEDTPVGLAASAVSVVNDPSPVNIGFAVAGNLPKIGLVAAYLGAYSDLVYYGEVKPAIQGMINAIPGNTMNNGNGLSIPNPAEADDCDVFDAGGSC